MQSVDSAGLVARNLSVGYAAPLIEADFRVEPGRVAAIVGPNGVGKTTLLKTLIGILPRLSGEVTLGNVAMESVRSREGIGYLPENLNLPPEWSGQGLLSMAALAGGTKGAAIEPAVRIAGVDFDLSQRAGAMSKGMRQRLGLAMALVPLPGLLVMDEPEAGLDPAQRVLMRERIRAFARSGDGRIVLIATHDVSSLVAMADDAFIITSGRLNPVGVDELADPARIVELFATGPRR